MIYFLSMFYFPVYDEKDHAKEKHYRHQYSYYYSYRHLVVRGSCVLILNIKTKHAQIKTDSKIIKFIYILNDFQIKTKIQTKIIDSQLGFFNNVFYVCSFTFDTVCIAYAIFRQPR